MIAKHPLSLVGLVVLCTGCTTVLPPQTATAPVSTLSPGQAGEYCREYQTMADVGGEAQQVVGTACREADGQWRIVQDFSGRGEPGGPVAAVPAYPAYPYYYYPPPYYAYPSWYGPQVSLGFGFFFGHHHRRR